MSTDRRPVVAEIKAGPNGRGQFLIHGADDNPEPLDISDVVGSVSVHIDPKHGRTVAIVNMPAVAPVLEGVTVELDAVTKAALERLGWKRA